MPTIFDLAAPQDDPRNGLPGRPGRHARNLRRLGGFFRERIPRVSRGRLVATVYLVLLGLTFLELLLELFLASVRLRELKEARERGGVGDNGTADLSATLPAYEGEGIPGRIRAFMLLVIQNVIIKDSGSSSSSSSSSTLSVHDEDSILAELQKNLSRLFNDTSTAVDF